MSLFSLLKSPSADLNLQGNNITALCAGLVIIDQRTNAVSLVHYTCKKFFEDVRQEIFPGYHANITMSCATYLSLEPLREASIWELVKDWPLAAYAAEHIGDHARLAPEDELDHNVLDILCQLLSHPLKRRPLVSLLDGLDLVRSGFCSNFAARNERTSIDSVPSLFST